MEDGPEITPGFVAALLQDEDNAPEIHLCARCDSPIEDPLEECPVCAAEWDEDAP